MLEFRTQSLFKPQWWQSTTSDAKKFPLSLRGDTPPHPIKQGYNLSLFSDTMETEGRIWFGNMIQVIARWRHSNSSWCACELITSVQRVALRLKTHTPASISVQEITTAASKKASLGNITLCFPPILPNSFEVKIGNDVFSIVILVLVVFGTENEFDYLYSFNQSCLSSAMLPLLSSFLKDGAYYCYCAYLLRISRYSDFLSPMLTNTGIFLRGLKLSGESRS